MKIKEWAEEDRPREKMLLKGIASLSDAELLAILIGSGNSQETAVQLSQRILGSVDNNLNALGKLSVKELKSKFKGIGQVKATIINAALELGKRRAGSDPIQRPAIRASKDAYQLYQALLCDLPHEELWIALTNRSSLVIEKFEISQGGTNETSAESGDQCSCGRHHRLPQPSFGLFSSQPAGRPADTTPPRRRPPDRSTAVRPHCPVRRQLLQLFGRREALNKSNLSVVLLLIVNYQLSIVN